MLVPNDTLPLCIDASLPPPAARMNCIFCFVTLLKGAHDGDAHDDDHEDDDHDDADDDDDADNHDDYPRYLCKFQGHNCHSSGGNH